MQEQTNHSGLPRDTAESTHDTDEFFELLWALLMLPKLPDDLPLPATGGKNLLSDRIVQNLLDLRELCGALSKGDLEASVDGKGYILSNLKALQANLRHLTWQTKRIAEGDFTQTVDFLGEFSESFNEMTAKLKMYDEQLKSQANFDQLTGLPNRYFLMQFLSKHFDKFCRDRDDVFSVLIIDVDNFKRINDTYGHGVGDSVLMQIGERLNAVFRSSDVLARYGGEEFLAVLVNADARTARTVAERARRAVQDATFSLPDEIRIEMTISVGISQADPDDTSYENVINRSDKALYLAKENGRNQVSVQ